MKPSDTPALTPTQQKTARTDLHLRATRQKEPSDFSAIVGSPLPGSVMITRVSSEAAKMAKLCRQCFAPESCRCDYEQL